MCYRTRYGQHIPVANRARNLSCIDNTSIACIVTDSSRHGRFMVAGVLWYSDSCMLSLLHTASTTKIHRHLAPSLGIEVLGSALAAALKALSIHGNSVPRTVYKSAFPLSFITAQELRALLSRNMYRVSALNFARRCLIQYQCRAWCKCKIDQLHNRCTTDTKWTQLYSNNQMQNTEYPTMQQVCQQMIPGALMH